MVQRIVVSIEFGLGFLGVWQLPQQATIKALNFLQRNVDDDPP